MKRQRSRTLCNYAGLTRFSRVSPKWFHTRLHTLSEPVHDTQKGYPGTAFDEQRFLSVLSVEL